jgi:hypothetical protein
MCLFLTNTKQASFILLGRNFVNGFGKRKMRRVSSVKVNILTIYRCITEKLLMQHQYNTGNNILIRRYHLIGHPISIRFFLTHHHPSTQVRWQQCGPLSCRHRAQTVPCQVWKRLHKYQVLYNHCIQFKEVQS